MFFSASCLLLTLLSLQSLAAFTAKTEQDPDDGSVDWKLIRAVDKLGEGERLYNDYIQVSYDIDYDSVDYYVYFVTYPGTVGNKSTIEPFPKGDLKIFNETGYGYFFFMDLDDNLNGLWDFRFGEKIPGVPAQKSGGFFVDPCSGNLVYDDTPNDDHYNGTFIATSRGDQAGTGYVRWFDGPGPLPEGYTEVDLKLDPAVSCEAMKCSVDEPELCDVDCEWEDSWEKASGENC